MARASVSSTSWLSREILAFNLFAGLASAYVAVACAGYLGVQIPLYAESALGISAGIAGLLAVICSMMIYIDTRRVFWGPLFTVTKFFGGVVCSQSRGRPSLMRTKWAANAHTAGNEACHQQFAISSRSFRCGY